MPDPTAEQEGFGPPEYRPEAPAMLEWCLQAADPRWMDVYRCERFHKAPLAQPSARVLEIPDYHELEAHLWCIEYTSARWSVFPRIHTIRFFFETEADAMLFKLRFGDDYNLIDLETNVLR